MSGEEWSIREFRALHAAITQRSITAAAAWLGVSQPAVSRTIATLEAKMGCRLFERFGRSIVPTDEAIRLNERLMPLLASLDELRAERGATIAGQRLRLSAPPAFANGYLQNVIGSFLEAHPDVLIDLDVRSSSVIVGEIADGLLELGISDMAIESKNVTRRPICVSSMACFIPASHILAREKVIDTQMLAGERIIALSRRHYARQQLDGLLTEANIADQVRIETSTTLSALAFVRRNLGVALMNPFPIAFGLHEDVCVVPLAREILYTTAFILPPTGTVRRTTEMFMRHLRQSLPKLPWLARVPR